MNALPLFVRLVLDTSALERKVDIGQLYGHEVFVPAAVLEELRLLATRRGRARAAEELEKWLEAVKGGKYVYHSSGRAARICANGVCAAKTRGCAPLGGGVFTAADTASRHPTPGAEQK